MNEIPDSETDFSTPIEPDARFSAGTGLLVALGVGLAIGAVVHALRPAPRPQQRLARMVEDLEDSLREMSAPALNKVGDLAADGAHVISNRLHRGEAQVEKFLRQATRRLRRFTS